MAEPQIRRKIRERNVPFEIIEEILRLLPVKPLLRFRSVSKSWKTLIDSDSFKFNHFQQASINAPSALLICQKDCVIGGDFPYYEYKPSFHFLSSFSNELISPPLFNLDFLGEDYTVKDPKFTGFVNGIALLCWDSVPFLWNPLTNEFRKIDVCHIEHVSYPSLVALGFDPNTNDYKVLIVYTSDNLRVYETKVDFHLYSLSSNSWKSWSSVYPYVFEARVVDGFLNGKSYWGGGRIVSAGGSIEPIVIVFDFCDDSFEVMPLPGELTRAVDFVAVTTRGYLELVVRFGEIDVYVEDRRAEIWGMGEDGSWRMKARVLWSTLGQPLGITKDGQVVFESADDRDILLINDTYVENLGVRSHKSFFFTYVENLSQSSVRLRTSES